MNRPLSGRCKFKPSIPVPDCFGLSYFFSEDAPIPQQCPAWKRAENAFAVPRWKEERSAWRDRLNREIARQNRIILEGLKSALRDCEEE